VFLPWDAAGLYYQHSSEGHAGLLSDVIDSLVPAGRQVRTNAHPLVEITVTRQRERTIVHLVNLSGHSQTAYFEPVPMDGIRVEVAGRWNRAKALRAGVPVEVRDNAGYTSLVVPRLTDYEAVILER
jgi:hypothetical protein